MTFDEIIKHVLQHEGGYVNDLKDPGGETKYGISKRSYPNVDIKALTMSAAIEIYKKDYWIPCKAELLPAGLQHIHFDTAVNCGLLRAAKILQKSAGVKDDGKIGSITLAAAQTCSIEKYASQRISFYDQIIKDKPILERFRKGWEKRVNDIVKLNT